ncbi:uncharacterized protein LOC108099679 [Drosophila ficusphila]|uniref:uncharacterized protein LOC108099679 n=1 Tax=Drosophila ficusphila TaxID=30025 RepID=UPI0007E87D86|nr:uncharacterized protein LOC108099679 [Drosophila ficusphila]
MDKEAEQLILQCTLESIGVGEFESGYCLSGKPILPPVMNDLKRLEMMRLRLCALTREAILKRDKLDRQVERRNAETNTEEPLRSANLVVMGNLRHKLVQSKTLIYDHTADLITQISAPQNVPIMKLSQLVMEDPQMMPPQRAVIRVAPVKLATSESGSVSRLDPLQIKSPERKEKAVEPLQRSTTNPDSLRLHHQLWRRNLLPSPMIELTVALKSETNICRARRRPSKDSVTGERLPSRIPRLIPIQMPIIPNFEAKAAPKRANQVRKKEAPTPKKKPPTKPPTTAHLNVPKIIRTPVAANRRPGCGESELQIQKNRFKKLFLQQAEENRRMQAEMQQEHQRLVTQMLHELNLAVEGADDPQFVERFLGMDTDLQ